MKKMAETTGSYHQLVLVAGPARSGKTAVLMEIGATKGWPVINANLSLSKTLMEFSQKQRALRAQRVLSDLVGKPGGNVILLDNLELLFAVELALDPLRLLHGLSRSRTVVASWPGTYDGKCLTYAVPGHPEFRKYTSPEANIVRTDEPPPETSGGGSSGAGQITQETE